MNRKILLLQTLSVAAIAAACGSSDSLDASSGPSGPSRPGAGTAETCVALVAKFKGGNATITSAEVRQAAAAAGNTPALPAHCDLTGSMDARTGSDSQPYAIKFHMRVPMGDAWNGRLVFSGGGGSNGDIGNAMSVNGTAVTPLAKGWAILSQDAGHDNEVNNIPEKGGERSFGFDFRARQDNFYRSHERAATVAKLVASEFAGKKPDRTYFAGCSKGGQEAGTVATRFPEIFDGIVMGDPLMPAPIASMVRPAWIAQTFGGLAAQQGIFDGNGLPFINKAFTDAQLAILKKGVADQCDALDGVVDGMSQDFKACTARFKPASLQCAPGQTSDCLPETHVTTIEKMMASFPGDTIAWMYDMGLVEGQYRSWWLGSATGSAGGTQSSNSWIGRAVSTMYATPPQATHSTLNNGSEPYRFLLNFNFATDIAGIYRTTAEFPESAYDMSLVSTDLSGLKSRGGKMVVYHGASDGAFSISQTIDWVEKVNAANGGDATGFMRFYAVPGMGHCRGGPSTSSFDMLTAVQEWVEEGKVPESVLATAPSGTPWPGRTRPLCTYPKVARYVGGDVNSASSFRCE